ncbi:MAG TPA: sigma factor-like helix-turn-helix DNA-binding protein [Acidimicrobiia bacterium]|nr:sigma factor-like helix-turn-helix DNA-binding protein [Acidimicrobiia bacterium]
MKTEQSGFDMDLFEGSAQPMSLDWLREIVDSLPPLEREVIECLFWQQLSIEAAALELDRSTYAVRGALDRGKKAIAKAMQEGDHLGQVPAEMLPGLRSLRLPLALVADRQDARSLLRAKDRRSKNRPR